MKGEVMTDEARVLVELEYQYGGVIVLRFSDGATEYDRGV